MVVPYQILTLFLYQITFTLSTLPTNCYPPSSVALYKNFSPHAYLSKEAPRSVRLTISVEPGTGPSPLPCLATVTVSPLLALETATSSSTTPPLVGSPGLPFSEALNTVASKGLPQLPLTDNLLTMMESPLQSDILRGPRALPSSLPSSENKPPLLGFSRFTPFSRLSPAPIIETDPRVALVPLVENSLPIEAPRVPGSLLDEQTNYGTSRGYLHKKQLNNPQFNLEENEPVFKRINGLEMIPKKNYNLIKSDNGGSSKLLEQPNPISNLEVPRPSPFSTITEDSNTKVKDENNFNKEHELLHHKKPRLNVKSEIDDSILAVNSLVSEDLRSFERLSNNISPPANNLPTNTISQPDPIATKLNSKQSSSNKVIPYSISKNPSPPLSCPKTSRIAPVNNQIKTFESNLRVDDDSTKTVNTESNLQPLKTILNDPSLLKNLQTVDSEISSLNCPSSLNVNKPEITKDILPKDYGMAKSACFSKEGLLKLSPPLVQSPTFLTKPGLINSDVFESISGLYSGLPPSKESTLESKFSTISCIDPVKSSLTTPYISSITINIIPYVQEDESEIIILL